MAFSQGNAMTVTAVVEHVAAEEVPASATEVATQSSNALPTLISQQNQPQALEEKPNAEVVGAQGVDVEAGQNAEKHVASAPEQKEMVDRSIHIDVHVEYQNPCLRVVTFSTALVLFFFSVLCLFNIFFLMNRPFLYMLMGFNICAAGVIVIMDGTPVWNSKWRGMQWRLFRLVPCLAWRPGRAIFYMFVGSFNTSFFGYTWVFAACGSWLNLCGFLTLLTYCCGC